MSDPLSVASGVASLIAFGGATSKLFYSFFMSIINAPSSARDLASALFSLNVALGQVQELLLDPDFIQETKDEDIESLKLCLARCTNLFGDVDAGVRRCGLADSDQGTARKFWESIKRSYNEDKLKESLRSIADEKATLVLVIQAFNARMTAGILGKVEQLQVLAKKQDRRLKDIHIWCQWMTGISKKGKAETQHAEYSGFTASQAYTSGDMGNLLHSSGSVLSLQIGDLSDDSVSAIWTPDSASMISPRRIKSILRPTKPTLAELHKVQAVLSEEVPGRPDGETHLSCLETLSQVYSLAQRSCAKKSVMLLSKHMIRFLSPLRVATTFSPLAGLIMPSAEFWRSCQRGFSNAVFTNNNIIEDLRKIGDLIADIEYIAKDVEIANELSESKEKVLETLMEYLTYANKCFNGQSGKHVEPVLAGKRILKDITGETDEKRERYMRKIETAIGAYRSRYEVRVVARSHRLQQKMIEQQEKTLKLQEDQLTLQRLVANNLEALSKSTHQPKSEFTADLAGSLDLAAEEGPPTADRTFGLASPLINLDGQGDSHSSSLERRSIHTIYYGYDRQKQQHPNELADSSNHKDQISRRRSI